MKRLLRPLALAAVCALLAVPGAALGAGASTSPAGAVAGGAAAPATPTVSTPTVTVPPTATTPAGAQTAPATTTLTPSAAGTPGTASTPASTTAAKAGPKGGGGVSGWAILAAVLGALVVLACVVWAVFRWGAYEPHWLVSARHATAEAGYRASATWAELTDWARLGH